MSIRGLVIGKFYPPHRGHKLLIDTACAQSDQVTVLICRRPGEMPPTEQRAAWLREIHPTAQVLMIEDTVDSDDSEGWARYTIEFLGWSPDVVFTSESYGERYAHFLKCQHVLVDQARIRVPISGTKVRSNPLRYWDFLEPPVRAFYARRVCLVGAESTGKTTLAAQLAEQFQTVWVPEYGREYSEWKLEQEGGYHWQSDEFSHIARTQCERETAAARQANRVLICDTDAFATSIWHRRYLEFPSSEVEAIAAAHRRPDLYLVPDVNTPFVQDGTRDGEDIRHWMHTQFLSELTRQARPFEVLTGSFQERFDQAQSLIDGLLRNGGSND